MIVVRGPLEAVPWLSRLITGALLGCVACSRSTATRIPAAGSGGADVGVHAVCVPLAIELGMFASEGMEAAVPVLPAAGTPRFGAYARRSA